MCLSARESNSNNCEKNPICKSTALFVLQAAEYLSRAASHKYVHFCEVWSEAETIVIQRETALPTFRLI